MHTCICMYVHVYIPIIMYNHHAYVDYIYYVYNLQIIIIIIKYYMHPAMPCVCARVRAFYATSTL